MGKMLTASITYTRYEVLYCGKEVQRFREGLLVKVKMEDSRSQKWRRTDGMDQIIIINNAFNEDLP